MRIRLYFFCVMLLAGVRAEAGVALPMVPPFPDFSKLAPYNEPGEKSQSAALKEAIQDFEQFAQKDLPDFWGKNEASARRTGQHWYRMESPNGLEQLYIKEVKGIATEMHYYRITDMAARKLDPRLSRDVLFMDRNTMCTFSNQAGQHVSVTIGDSPHVRAYGALGLGDKIYQAFWDDKGRMTRDETIPLERMKSRQIELRSTEFTARLDPKPYLSGFAKPAQAETATGLDTTLRAMSDDLGEMAGLANAGKMKWEETSKNQCVGRYEAADKTKIVAVALKTDRRTLQQGNSTLYDRIPEIRESVLRDSSFTCFPDGTGLYQYNLRTPQFESRVEFYANHKLHGFTIDWFAKGESRSMLWDEAGKIMTEK